MIDMMISGPAYVYCDLSHDSGEGHNVDGEFKLENNLKYKSRGRVLCELNQSYT
jgi:hypothetical protein